jgi:hypothetical protein
MVGLEAWVVYFNIVKVILEYKSQWVMMLKQGLHSIDKSLLNFLGFDKHFQTI